jgi:hypothetical protein
MLHIHPGQWTDQSLPRLSHKKMDVPRDESLAAKAVDSRFLSSSPPLLALLGFGFSWRPLLYLLKFKDSLALHDS